MSLSIGQAATDAARVLSTDAGFTHILDWLHESASAKAVSALGAPVEHRIDATSYARALSDVYLALASAAAGVRQDRTSRPRLPRVKPEQPADGGSAQA